MVLEKPQRRLTYTYIFDALVNALDELLDGRQTTSAWVLLTPSSEDRENESTV